MSETSFAEQLAQDLEAEDLRVVLDVFRDDVARLTAVLDANAAAGDVAAFRRTCHALAGAAGAVGAGVLERACRLEMVRTDLTPDRLAPMAALLRRLGEAALEDMAAFLATLPEG